MSLELLAVVAAVVVAGLIAGKLGFRQRKLPAALELLLGTGTPFIFLGIFLGPQGVGVITGNIWHKVGPIVLMGFGWIGFLYGTHFEWRQLRRFKARVYFAGFWESILTMGVVSGVAWFVLPYVEPGLQTKLRFAASLGLGICAAGTAPGGISTLAGRGTVKRKDIELVQFFAAIDDLPAILALGVVFAVLAPQAISGTAGLLGLAVSLALGAVLGLVSHFLMPVSRKGRSHSFVVILGMASLCAGAADMLGLSPLFVSVIGGVVFTNLSPRKEAVYGIMVRRESTLYAVFLILAGALIHFQSTRIVLLVVPLYALLRAGAKLVGGRTGAIIAGQPKSHPLLGLGLLFQGGLGLVIAVQLDYGADVPVSRLFMTTVVLAVVLNDLLAAPLAYRHLARSRS